MYVLMFSPVHLFLAQVVTMKAAWQCGSDLWQDRLWKKEVCRLQKARLRSAILCGSGLAKVLEVKADLGVVYYFMGWVSEAQDMLKASVDNVTPGMVSSEVLGRRYWDLGVRGSLL